ncbi:MAG: enoyl-ACP reductase FabI [Anaerolineae bacterium]
MGLLDGKVAFIFGVANHRSIAWGIAKQMHEHGATIALSIFNEDMRRRVAPLAEEIGCDFIEECDVNDDQSVDAVFEKFAERYGRLDVLVHSIAYAPREALGGRFIDITRDDFKLTLESSAYSLVALARRSESLMTEGGSIMSMTYLAAERYIPDYNAMAVAKSALESCTRYMAVDMGPQKIRVNAISAGPLKTLAAAGIPGFRGLLKHFDSVSPLGEAITIEDVGNTAVYLASDLSKMVTGEVIYVDSGYQVLGLTSPRDEM